MDPRDVNEKVDAMKSYLEELYDEGVIKPQEYNDLWSKISELKITIQCDK